ncbi:MAG: hypothetical protein OEZ04_09555 [Nitrospinota bacterium]|nr:hypothetical protein [Nitrospinota bacterium]
MKAKSETAIMRDCMVMLLEESKSLSGHLRVVNFETVDQSRVLSFSKKAKGIHMELIEAFNPSEGRSRILQRFFVQWNNMLFGVFHVEQALLSFGMLTESQFDILRDALEEIISNLEKNPVMTRLRVAMDEKN